MKRYDYKKAKAIADRLTKQGGTPADFITELGIAKSTFYVWKRKRPEFKRMVQRLKGRRGQPAFKPPVDEIKKLAAMGLNKTQIAAMLGIRYSTYMDNQRAYPEMAEAYEAGSEVGVGQVKGKLYQKAMAGDNWAIGTFLKRHDHETEVAPDKIEIEVLYTTKKAGELDEI